MKSTITAEKSELRRAVKEYRITESERRINDDQLFQRLLEHPFLKAAETVLLFYGVGTEPHTAHIFEKLMDLGKQLALPHCLPHSQMEARLYLGQEHCVTSSYGIPEPDDRCPVIPKRDISLILVPNLLCDRRGFRLGHGGGYYDRYLADFSGLTISLCRDALLRDRLPVDRYDRPVHCVLTETQSLSF